MNILSRMRQGVEEYANELFLIAVLVTVAFVGFGAGRLSAPGDTAGDLVIESTPVGAEELAKITNPNVTVATEQGNGLTTGPIVGNKNSKIYHRQDCSGAKNMAEANKVFFASAVDAQAAGFRPAGNCPGLN